MASLDMAEASRREGTACPIVTVRWALILSTLTGLIAFALFWMARRTIREEMES